MPSPFARTLQKGGCGKWIPLVVIVVVVFLLAYLYYFTGGDEPKQFIARPITKRKDELSATIVASTGYVTMPGVNSLVEQKEMFYSTAGLESLPIFFLVCFVSFLVTI